MKKRKIKKKMEREAEVNHLNGSLQLNKLSLSKKLSRSNFKELMNLNLLILEKMKPIILMKQKKNLGRQGILMEIGQTNN